MSNPGLLLVVPVHETFVTVSSPEEVKSRLSQPRSPVKPTKEEQAAYEERHALLASLHLDAIKRKAARENERAAEAIRRVRRAEAAEKQRLRERQELDEARAAKKREALEAEAAEKRARREALKEAFFATRASMAMAAHNRAVERLERNGQAEAKRNKLMQATVHKSAWEVKHAIAVATAAKEKAVEEAAQKSLLLQEKMAAAESRRLERLENLASPPSPTAASSPTGITPAGEQRFGRAHSRARQVATLLNEEAVALEVKRQRLSLAMETALARRAEKIEAKRQRAAAYKERAQQAFEARRAASEDAIKSLRHLHLEKEQAAEVRGMLHLRARAGRKPRTSFAMDVALDKANVVPPAALVARLSVKPQLIALATSAAERHVRAAARVAVARKEKLAALATFKARAGAAADRRALVTAVRAAKLAAKDAASSVVLASARAQRTAAAGQMVKRVELAKRRRAAARAEELAVLESYAKRRAAADKKRAARLAKPTTLEARALLFATQRATLDGDVCRRGEEDAKKQEAAAARRQQHLSALVAKAKMAAILRTTSVKFTLVTPAGSDVPIVQVSFVLPGEKTGAEKPEEVATDDKNGKKAVTKPAGKSVIGRIRNFLFS